MVVSGFAGAGKSTFIGQMRKGTLAEDIRARFPLYVETWTEISATQARALAQMRSGPGATEATHPLQAILHYPIDQFQRGGLRPYRLDPVFAVLPNVNHAVAVVLCVSRQRLIAQFSDRLAEKVRRHGRRGELIRRLFRVPLRGVRRRLRGDETLPPDPSLYRDLGWLTHCFNSWVGFLQGALDGRPNSGIIYVKPTLTDRGEPAFALLDPAGCTAALTDER